MAGIESFIDLGFGKRSNTVGTGKGKGTGTGSGSRRTQSSGSIGSGTGMGGGPSSPLRNVNIPIFGSRATSAVGKDTRKKDSKEIVNEIGIPKEAPTLPPIPTSESAISLVEDSTINLKENPIPSPPVSLGSPSPSPAFPFPEKYIPKPEYTSSNPTINSNPLTSPSSSSVHSINSPSIFGSPSLNITTNQKLTKTDSRATTTTTHSNHIHSPPLTPRDSPRIRSLADVMAPAFSRDDWSPRRSDGNPEGRFGYQSAMETIKYMGGEKAHDVLLALKVLAPFCDLLREWGRWEREERERVVVIGRKEEGRGVDGGVMMKEGLAGSASLSSTTSLSTLARSSDDDDAISPIPPPLSTPLSPTPSLLEQQKKQRRLVKLSCGLLESDLPGPEREAFKVLIRYTHGKMNKKSGGSGRGRGMRGLLGEKEIGEVVGKLEVLEEQLASYNYLPLFDLVRRQTTLPARIPSATNLTLSPNGSAPPMNRSISASAEIPQTQTGAGSGSGSTGLAGLPTSVLEAFDLGPAILATPNHKRSPSVTSNGIPHSTSNRSLSRMLLSPDKAKGPRSPFRTRPHTADSTTTMSGGLRKPFGFGSRSSKGSPKSMMGTGGSSLPFDSPTKSTPTALTRGPSTSSAGSGGRGVGGTNGPAAELGSDDEEFGSMSVSPTRGEFPEEEPRSLMFGDGGGLGVRTIGGGPPSSFRAPPLKALPSDFLHLGSGAGSTNNNSTSSPSAGVGEIGTKAHGTYQSHKKMSMILPAGPSTFRLPMARQDPSMSGSGMGSPNGSRRNTSFSSPLNSPESDTVPSWTSGTNTPAEAESGGTFPITSPPNTLQGDLTKTSTTKTPDLTSPIRARRRELLLAAGITPPSDLAHMINKGLPALPSPPASTSIPTSPPPAAPALPAAPMPSAIPMTGIRRPRTPSGSGSRGGRFGSAEVGSVLDGVNKRKAILVLDGEENQVFQKVVAGEAHAFNPSGKSTMEEQDDEADHGDKMGKGYTAGELSNPTARLGRIKSAEQMLASLSSRQSSLISAGGEGTESLNATPSTFTSPTTTHLSTSTSMSMLALRRLSDLPEDVEEDDHRASRIADRSAIGAKRDTSNTVSTTDGGITMSPPPSMITDSSSSNHTSVRFSGEVSPGGSAIPQTPDSMRDNNEVSSPITGYAKVEEVIEQGRQMLLEVFGNEWDGTSSEEEGNDDIDHEQTRRPSTSLLEGILQGKVMIGKRPSRPEAEGRGGIGVVRPESTMYGTWV